MQDIFIAIASIAVGVVATVYASRHYYRRSIDKELTPFIQLQSNVLSHIDKEVKSDLHIEYKGVKVENLQQLQFLVANTGERAIRDIIRPLRLELPQGVEIMDASLLHVFPEGREVQLKSDEDSHSVEFIFPLLNRDEFFIFKLLVKGSPKREDLRFHIVADDLLPQIQIRRLTYNQIEREGKNDKEESEGGLLVAGVMSLFLAFSIGILAHYIPIDAMPTLDSESFTWINKVPFIRIASIIGYILTAILGLAGVAFVAGAFFGNIEIPKSKKFRIPNELAAAAYGIRAHDEELVMRRMNANNSMRTNAEASAD